MLLFSLLNLRITKNAVNIGTYSLEFPVVIFEIMVCVMCYFLRQEQLRRKRKFSKKSLALQ